jgi:uncharacterized protein
MIIVFYHSADLDGVCSAAIALQRYPDAELRPINYDDNFEEKVFSNVASDDTVIMVDFGIKPIKQMIRLSNICKELVWIDHHYDIINEAKKHKFFPAGILEDGIAGCVLTWNYFFPQMPVPIGVDFIGRFDVRKINSNDIFPFYYGVDMHEKNPRDYMWKKIFSNDKKFLDLLIYDGRIIEHFIKKSDVESSMRNGSTVVLGDYTVFLLNDYVELEHIRESGIFKDDVHDFLMIFKKNKNGWKFSLRSVRDDIDVCEIAKMFKGGGHKRASGFTIKDENFIGKILKGKILIKKIEGA